MRVGNSLPHHTTLQPAEGADNPEAIAAGGTNPGSKLLAWCLITFLENLKIFRRYSDREWVVIILRS